jgi:carbamate kinase
MLVVVALGGNALLQRGQRLTVEAQRANAEFAARAVAEIAVEHHVVVTHGSGPQVGLLALQSAALRDVPSYPLDVLDAESEGMVGYLLEQELGRHIPPDRLATLLTQVVVDPDDAAFARPTSPVGPLYAGLEAERLARARQWTIGCDRGGWRRLVASPRPTAIVELPTVRILVDHGVTVICAGGGGIPVVRTSTGDLRGVEAVVDKDLTAALLATALDADALLLLTDAHGVYADFGADDARALETTTVEELRSLRLPASSMGPKVDAVCSFVEQGGWLGGIGALGDAAAILRGEAGTRLGPAVDRGRFAAGAAALAAIVPSGYQSP